MVSVNFVWTYAGLLSTRELTKCHHAADPDCYGGIAMVMALVRATTDENVIGNLVMPRFDFESAFSQMHPVSRPIADGRDSSPEHYSSLDS